MANIIDLCIQATVQFKSSMLSIATCGYTNEIEVSWKKKKLAAMHGIGSKFCLTALTGSCIVMESLFLTQYLCSY